MKSKCSLLMILSIWALTSLSAEADLSALSQAKKKPVITKKVAPKVNKTVRSPKYRAYASNKPEKPLEEAIIWHAPPYKKMARKLSAKEEVMRDMKALEILNIGAEENYKQIKKAKKILEKSNSPFTLIAKEVLNTVNVLTLNLDLTNYRKVRTKEDAQELLEEVNKYLVSNYHVYKSNFFINDMRNKKFKEKISKSRENLALISGTEQVNQVDKLFLGDYYAI